VANVTLGIVLSVLVFGASLAGAPTITGILAAWRAANQTSALTALCWACRDFADDDAGLEAAFSRPGNDGPGFASVGPNHVASYGISTCRVAPGAGDLRRGDKTIFNGMKEFNMIYSLT